MVFSNFYKYNFMIMGLFPLFMYLCSIYNIYPAECCNELSTKLEGDSKCSRECCTTQLSSWFNDLVNFFTSPKNPTHESATPKIDADSTVFTIKPLVETNANDSCKDVDTPSFRII
jgi:hypothetical protein